MNIDKRYIELLAGAVPAKYPKWIKYAAIMGFLVILVGGVIFMGGKLYGFAVVWLGAVICGFSIVKQNKVLKSHRQAFMEYYERHEALPPWPENTDK